MNNIEKLRPFKHFCMTIGSLPTSYIESMSYYETLCWLCKYLENTVVPTVNNNSEVVEELQNYVENYFENLDVQNEINNKLDEMADDGTLAQIINVEMIGSLQDLTTTDKTDLVSAINEVNASIGDVPAIGDLEDLTTTAKTDLVSAINEVDGIADTNTSNITTNTNAIGVLTNLTTTAKTDLVSAINEVNDLTNKIETVTGTYTSDGTTGAASITISYPTGFTQNNTHVIGSYKTIPDKSNYYIGGIGSTYDYSQKNPGQVIVLGTENITVRLSCIQMEGVPSYTLAEGDYTVTLLLLKL